MHQTEKVEFQNNEGETLSGRLEMPLTQPLAYAVFAHCFTCSKDIAAASRIARGMTRYGVAVLRFDFTGLGNSDGDFANTNFSSNVQDLKAAADEILNGWAARQRTSPLLVLQETNPFCVKKMTCRSP